MKLHFLSAGRVRLKKSIYDKAADRSETFEAPVSSALIRHKQGNVLFDTGCHPSRRRARRGTMGFADEGHDAGDARGGDAAAKSFLRRHQP